LLIPLALAAWTLAHASGVHATVAGIALGLLVPVVRNDTAEHFEHAWRPLSSGFAVPVFALFSAGVVIEGVQGLRDAVTDPVALGVIAGLVLGKPLGIVGTTWVVSKLTRASLDPSLRWVDVVGMAFLAGMGFTVSLLIAGLAFGEGSPAGQHVTLGVLLGSALAAVVAALVLVRRNRAYRQIEAEEQVDATGGLSRTGARLRPRGVSTPERGHDDRDLEEDQPWPST